MIISQEQFRDYYDQDIFVLSSGTAIVVLDVKYMGYDRDIATRWQDGHKQIALGLMVKHPRDTFIRLCWRFERITGHKISRTTIRYILGTFSIMEQGYSDNAKDMVQLRATQHAKALHTEKL